MAKKSASFLKDGIKKGYFRVQDSGAISLDIASFAKSKEGKEHLLGIVNSMPKPKKRVS